MKVKRLTGSASLCLVPIAFGLSILASCNQSSAQSAASATGDLSGLSDEFDRTQTLPNWQRIERLEGWQNNQLEAFDVGGVQGGWLTLMPYASTWYQDYRGVLVYKPVQGDFVVTTHLKVSRRGGGGPPQAQFSLAGIMVRTPRTITPSTWQPGHENYVFLSLGAADQPGAYQFEVKTTRNSDSQLALSPAGSGEAVIRVARIGKYIFCLKKVNGQWSLHRRYTREDFPQTLQVGLTCYTDWPTASQLPPAQHNRTVIKNGNPDLLALVDYVRYARPPSTLLNRQLDSVADPEILQALGNE